MFDKIGQAKKWAKNRLAKNLNFDRAVIEWDSCQRVYHVNLLEKYERCLIATSTIVDIIRR